MRDDIKEAGVGEQGHTAVGTGMLTHHRGSAVAVPRCMVGTGGLRQVWLWHPLPGERQRNCSGLLMTPKLKQQPPLFH